MLSRKHFKEVATILKDSKNEITNLAFENLVLDFSIMFKNDNDRFDLHKFKTACGLE